MKAKYQKPICECGSGIYIVEEKTVDVITYINKKGLCCKKEYIGAMHPNSISFLDCGEISCQSTYEIDYDDKGRYIRGDKR